MTSATLTEHADLRARLADARTALSSVVLPLVINAVALHRRALEAKVWPDDVDEFDRTFQRWAIESGAGQLRASLDEISAVIAEADIPLTHAGLGEPSPLPHGGECGAVGGLAGASTLVNPGR